MTKRKRPDTTDDKAKEGFEASYLESVKQTREYMQEDVYEEFTGSPEPQTPPRQVRTEAAARDKAKHEDAKEGIKRPVGRPRKPVQVTDATNAEELEEDLQESSVVEELRTKKRLSEDDLLNIAENLIVPFAETLTGCKLFSYQREFAIGVAVAALEGKAKTVTALFARQCIGGDEFIVGRDGRPVKIKNHENAWCTGEKETYTVKTSTGHSIANITLDHTVLTKNGWRELRDVQVGDAVAVCDSTPTCSDEKNDENFCELLGHLTSDGYFYKAVKAGQSIKFTNTNEEILLRVEYLVEKTNSGFTKRYKKGNGFDIIITQTPLRDFVNTNEFVSKFPMCIFDYDEKSKGRFLSAMLSSDGYVYLQKNQVGYSCGGDYDYADLLRILLRSVGVRSSIKMEFMCGNPFYRVIIGGKRWLERLYTLVTPVVAKDDKFVKLLSQLISRQTKTNKNVNVDISDGEEIVWSTIRSIQKNKNVTKVYDTEVPEKGWFDCGGIVCHNSGKSQTVAVIVAGLGILIPTLANVFEAEQFQRFKNGFFVGIYGPDYDKASIVYGRIKDMLSSPTALEIMKDPDLGVDPKDAPRMKFKNGFRVDLRTANKDAKIEGFSYHLIILDEAQDMSAMVIEKSIRPMRNFYAGAVVYIGTPCPERTVFQDTCLRNAATDRANGVEDHIHRLHYEFDYRYVLKARPEYRISIEEDMEIMGEHSDAFRMAYKLEWLDGKGKFTTQAEFNQTMIRQRKVIKDFKLERGRRVEKEFVLDEVFLGSDKNDTCMFSIDYGGKNDSTVLTIAKVWLDCPIEIGDKYRYNKHVVDFLELLGDDHEEQFPQILAKLNEYNIVAGIDDCTGLGDPVHQRLAAVLRRRGIVVHPFIFSQKSKHEGFALLKQELSSGRLTFPGGLSATATKKHKNMTRQMLELVRDYNEKTKLNTYKAPDVKDAHDDFPCSIMMLTHLVDVLTLPTLEFTDTSEWQRTKRSVEAQRRYLQYLNKVNAPNNPHLAPSTPRPRMFAGRGLQGKSFEELLEEETKGQ